MGKKVLFTNSFKVVHTDKLLWDAWVTVTALCMNVLMNKSILVGIISKYLKKKKSAHAGICSSGLVPGGSVMRQDGPGCLKSSHYVEE